MSKIRADEIVDKAGVGAPQFTNGLETTTISGTASNAPSLPYGLTIGDSTLGPVTGSAPSYTCRAWVNFSGTGTVAIRASGNVSSITDNGLGDYIVNFTTAMPDTSSAVLGFAHGGSGATAQFSVTSSASSTQVICRIGTTYFDPTDYHVAIFR